MFNLTSVLRSKGTLAGFSIRVPSAPVVFGTFMRVFKGGKQLSSSRYTVYGLSCRSVYLSWIDPPHSRSQRLVARAPYSPVPAKMCVYVGNLPFDTSWQDLKDHMKSAGTVVRATMLEGKDGQSKGCAVVSFATATDAQRAIDTLSDSELGGRKIFVREDRVGTPETVGMSGRVYIGNLPWSTDWKELKDLLRQCGEVLHVDVAMEGDRSKGFATAEFASAEEAAACIRRFSGYELEGRTLHVREDRNPRASGVALSSDARLRRLFIGNVPLSVTWQELKDHLRQHCEVTHVDIVMDGDRSKCYAIAEFASTSDAVECIRQFNNTEFKGSSLNIREDRGGSHRPPTAPRPTQEDGRIVKSISQGSTSTCRVFVNNLSWEVAWQDLKDHFRSCGEVVRADVALEDGSRRSRGFGFVEFSNPSETAQAIRVLNNSLLLGREIYVREDRESPAGVPE